MKIKHCWNKNKIEKEIDDVLGFLLTNNNGDYFSLGGKPSSRYQGWFLNPFELKEKKLFKVIEDIEIKSSPKILEISNHFWSIERKREKIIEKFFLPSCYHSLIYELSEPSEIELFLDIKESYDNQEEGRFYEIFKNEDVVLIKCQNKEDIFYLAIKSDILNYSEIKEWTLRYYQLDKKRNSFPFERYVYQALKIKAQKIVFSVAPEKDKAIKEVKEVFKKREGLKELAREEIKKLFKNKESKKIIFKKNISEEIKMAYLCVQNSLKGLIILQNNLSGFYAGLPWSFQFWSRDEAISLKALKKINPSLAKKILFDLLGKIKEDGKMPNILFRETPFLYKENIDASGWIFQRIAEFKKNYFKKGEIKKISQSLEKTIEGLSEHHCKEGFIIGEAKETWMDTQEREGARIEIQALLLNLYNLAYQLTQKEKYFQLEKSFKKKVREKFWNGEILADGIDDFTIRPNIFLVAYIYPQLLTKKEWLRCFENVLSKLYLEWGGLSTIDKKDFRFTPQSTGEDIKSYHNGDSWFWINNLAALVLARFNKKKFKKYIEKILEASAKEILWLGVISHHSELSSANRLESGGCWVQAWSNALYLELISEIIFSKK